MKVKRFVKSSLILIFLGGILLGCYYYIKSVQLSLWTQTAEQVLEITTQGARAFETYVTVAQEQTHSLANVLSGMNASEGTRILDNLNLLGGEIYNYTVVDLDHGFLYSNRLEYRLLLDEEELEFYRGFSGNGIRENYLNIYDGHKTMGVYECFTFADGTQGLIQKGRKISELSQIFPISFFNETGFSYITNQDGDVLIRPSHKNSNRTFSNIFDMIADDNDAEDIRTFRESLANGSSGVIQLSFNGSENILTFSPIKGTEGWCIISIIPSSVVMDNTDDILQASQVFVYAFFCVFATGLAILLFERHCRKQIESKEQDVQYREQLFSILSENIDDVFLMLNGETHAVEYVTPNVERVLGISGEEVAADLYTLQESAQSGGEPISFPDLADMQPGQSVTLESRRTHRKTAETRWFHDSFYCVGDSRSDKFIVILSDRTKEKQNKLVLEAALDAVNAANQAKSVFFNNVSHDIRTPMNAIMGFATLLDYEAGDPGRVREYTRKIKVSSQYLLSLINDVLDMSKIESGKTTLNLTEISLAELIDELVTMIRPQAEAKQQEFGFYRKDVTTDRLIGDRTRIKQVLLNILSNAVKYTPEGGRIRMTVTQLPQKVKEFAALRFEVQDNGIGMSEEFLKVIFEPFARENSTVVSQMQGTGLGMPIVKNLVELMGGMIDVKSKKGEGSLFTVELELRIQDTEQLSEENSGARETAGEGISGSRLAGLNILAAEDNELNAEILSELLRLNGASCEIVSNGRELVEAFGESRPGQYDLILTDIQMPVMNGYEAARAIRAGGHPCGQDIPIVAMTANAFAEDVREAMDAGMDAHVPKPIDMKELESVIAGLMKKKE